MNNDRPVPPQVSLGCGTLILIALIVLILGNAGSADNEEEFKKINQKLDSMDSTITDLKRELSDLRKELKKTQKDR